MKPGERITLIRRIAATLGTQDWSEIDLTLRQFGFSTSDRWDGDATSYVIHHVEGAGDDGLTELDAYLNPGDVEPTEPQPEPEVADDPDSPWRTGGFRLFITHLATQRENVSKLSDALAAHSIEAFVAHEDIEPSKEWQRVIEAALRSCDGVAAWMSPGFRESDWCDQEIGFGVARRILVIPIRFGLDPYGFVGKYQAVTSRPGQKLAEVAGTVFNLIVGHELSREAMARTLVWRYESSRSFDEARTNLGFLRRIPAEAWTPALKEQARTAHERNGQIRQAYFGSSTVPDAVERLLADLP